MFLRLDHIYPPALMTVDLLTLYAKVHLFGTRWHTLINVTFSYVLKVCQCVFEETKTRNFKISQAKA